MSTSQLKIIFCLPGNNFSAKFMECWTNLVSYCLCNNILFLISRKESCNIYYVRNMCLCANVSRGKDQKPFNGQVDYDYIMWIDSDIVFTPQHFQKLLDDDKKIVSGIYPYLPQNDSLACGRWKNDGFLKENTDVHIFTFNNINEIEPDINGLIQVDYCGFGFMLIKKGVFESMEYPWFKPLLFELNNIKDQMTDDLGWCYRAKQKGFKIFIDPSVRVSHEKKSIF